MIKKDINEDAKSIKKDAESIMGENSRLIEKINEKSCDFDELEKNLNKVVDVVRAQSEIFKYIYGETQLMELEGSVKSGYSIYIKTSKFNLETRNKKFRNMLINNLRKGVYYKYLIPSTSTESFNDMILDWWKEYSSFLKSEQDCDELYKKKEKDWDNEYVGHLENARQYWKNKELDNLKQLPKSLLDLFNQQFLAYTAESNTFGLTIAFYEMDHHKYKAIVKLPTDIENYSEDYSFIVFGDKEKSRDNTPLVSDFLNNFSDERTKYDINNKNIVTKIDAYNKKLLNFKGIENA